MDEYIYVSHVFISEISIFGRNQNITRLKINVLFLIYMYIYIEIFVDDIKA